MYISYLGAPWTLEPVRSVISGAAPPEFNYPTGPTACIYEVHKTPLDMLKLFLTSVVMESVLSQTKLFAAHRKALLRKYLWTKLSNGSTSPASGLRLLVNS